MSHENIRILYAEDEQSTQEFVKTLFKKVENIEVTFASDGEEALALYKKNRFDLVVTDVYMPHMNGFELIENIKKIDPAQTFVMVTGMQEREDLVQAIYLRVNLFLQKPIKKEKFLETFKLAKNIIADKKEHERLKTQLEQELEHRLKLIKEHEKTIIQQSKLVAIGEMLDAVAHQWRQPLHIIKMQADMLKITNRDETPCKEEIDEAMRTIISQTDHLDETLGEFRHFFRPVEKLERVKVKKLLDSTLLLLKDELIKNCVVVQLDGELECEADILQNEFKHVFINLINNSKDAYNDNKIENENRIIYISIAELQASVIITLEDNAGGVPADILENIFDPNISTKEYGTGIGLYMSKQIVNKINGTIEVKNSQNGAVFTIGLPKKGLSHGE